MGFDGWTFALEIGNFLVLAAILHRLLFKRVRAIVAERQKAIADRFAEADDKEREAEQAREQYEAEKAEFRAQRDVEIARDRETMEKERARVLLEAREDASSLARAVRERLAVERERALVELRGETAQLAVQIATRLISDLRISSWLDLFFERACERLKKEIITAPSGDARVAPSMTVVTSHSISGEQREQWRAALRELVDRDLSISFDTDDGLVAGVELRVDSSTLGGAHARFAWSDVLGDIEKALIADKGSDADAA